MTISDRLPLDQILHGDCTSLLFDLPAASIDLVFADPPYNLQLHQELWRPNLTRVNPVDAIWDHFADFHAYDEFSQRWLDGVRHVLKPTGTLWVIGTYHNIHRIGALMQDMGFWILNDIAWIKDNPMPNFRGVRFTNAHETIIWAQKERGAPYTFHHHAMKALNEGLQMRSDWYLPICTGTERLRQNGEKVHPTQKPEALLQRILLSSSNLGDIILDPFFGTGTTGVVARRLRRHWIGIERDEYYINQALMRIQSVEPLKDDHSLAATPDPRKQPRIPFGLLLEYELLKPGDVLYFNGNSQEQASIFVDSSIDYNGVRGSIHQIARLIRQAPGNGWELWFYHDHDSEKMLPIDHLRQLLRVRLYPETGQSVSDDG